MFFYDLYVVLIYFKKYLTSLCSDGGFSRGFRDLSSNLSHSNKLYFMLKEGGGGGGRGGGEIQIQRNTKDEQTTTALLGLTRLPV